MGDVSFHSDCSTNAFFSCNGVLLITFIVAPYERALPVTIASGSPYRFIIFLKKIGAALRSRRRKQGETAGRAERPGGSVLTFCPGVNCLLSSHGADGAAEPRER